MELTKTLAALTVISATLPVGRAQAQLPDPGLTVERSNTALVLTDPQNDFLSPTGVTWGLVGKSVTANHTVENIESLLKTAKQTGFLVFVSPLRGSGADWLERYKPYLDDGHTVVASPHKVYGPQANDLALQLRKRGISKVILAGMSANLCVESHLREFLEQGFEVAVVKDATAAAQAPDLDGYAAALVNFRFLANTVWTTAQATAAMEGATGVERSR